MIPFSLSPGLQPISPEPFRRGFIDNPLLGKTNQLILSPREADNDTVFLSRSLASHVARNNILANKFGVTAERIAIASSPREVQMNNLTALEINLCLGMRPLSISQNELARGAGLAAQQTRRRIFSSIDDTAYAPPTVGTVGELGHLTQAAPPSTSPTRVRSKLATAHDQR